MSTLILWNVKNKSQFKICIFLFLTHVTYVNVIESYQLLLEYFNTNTVFSIKKNRKDVVLVSDDESAENASLSCALKEMEKAGILRSCAIENDQYWVLFKSIESFNQTVELSGLVCAGIASVINDMCDKLERQSEKCDPSNVSEKDLKNLIYLASKTTVSNLKN
jgi:hypothetical protein